MKKIKLFKGDQILISGIEASFLVKVPEIDWGLKKKIKTSKPRPQKPIQLSLLALTQIPSVEG